MQRNCGARGLPRTEILHFLDDFASLGIAIFDGVGEQAGVGSGVAVLVEAFRQLMGKAGGRQVANLVNAIETASGGTWMDSHVTILSGKAA